MCLPSGDFLVIYYQKDFIKLFEKVNFNGTESVEFPLDFLTFTDDNEKIVYNKNQKSCYIQDLDYLFVPLISYSQEAQSEEEAKAKVINQINCDINNIFQKIYSCVDIAFFREKEKDDLIKSNKKIAQTSSGNLILIDETPEFILPFKGEFFVNCEYDKYSKCYIATAKTNIVILNTSQIQPIKFI